MKVCSFYYFLLLVKLRTCLTPILNHFYKIYGLYCCEHDKMIPISYWFCENILNGNDKIEPQ